MRKVDTEKLLNDFAVRSFRDVADRDYISARMNYRAGLFLQFQWSSLQAIEKYLKGILLLNRVPAKKVGHDLGKAIDLISKHAPFELRLDAAQRKFIDHLDTYGRFRYLEISYFIEGNELWLLDSTVWAVRRYCRVMNYNLSAEKGGDRNKLEVEIKANIDAERAPHKFRSISGELEKIIRNRKDPARKHLLWLNAHFATTTRKRMRVPRYFHATNSPLSLRPHLLKEVQRYVFLPRDVIQAFEERLEKEEDKQQ